MHRALQKVLLPLGLLSVQRPSGLRRRRMKASQSPFPVPLAIRTSRKTTS